MALSHRLLAAAGGWLASGTGEPIEWQIRAAPMPACQKHSLGVTQDQHGWCVCKLSIQCSSAANAVVHKCT